MDIVEKEKKRFICEMGSWVVGNPDENSTTTAVKSARGGGAVYAGNASQAARYQFRLAWRRAILSAGRKYQKRVSEEAHTTLLESMRQSLTDEFKSILAGNRMRIGIAQKGLNLYLKVLWCSGEICTPPHCTLDAGILAEAGVRRAWTKLDRVGEYEFCMVRCKKAAQQNRIIQHLLTKGCIQEKDMMAVWELFVWNEQHL